MDTITSSYAKYRALSFDSRGVHAPARRDLRGRARGPGTRPRMRTLRPAPSRAANPSRPTQLTYTESGQPLQRIASTVRERRKDGALFPLRIQQERAAIEIAGCFRRPGSC